jgi:hypothetical protein
MMMMMMMALMLEGAAVVTQKTFLLATISLVTASQVLHASP